MAMHFSLCYAKRQRETFERRLGIAKLKLSALERGASILWAPDRCCESQLPMRDETFQLYVLRRLLTALPCGPPNKLQWFARIVRLG